MFFRCVASMTSQNFILIEHEEYRKHEWFYDAEANVTYQNNRMGGQNNWHINSVRPHMLTQEECMVLTHKRLELIV